MNEEERADWLARAIDDLLNYDRQRPKEPPPPELDREELNALMRIASARVDSSNKLMHTGLLYEGEVWQTVLDRLDRRRFSREVRPFDVNERADDAATARALEKMEVDELREIARLRRELAEQASSIAEEHRADVWNRVQSRLEATPDRRWIFPFFRRAGRPERSLAAIDRGQAGTGRSESAAEEVNGLMELARIRRYGSRIVRKAAQRSESPVWERVSRSILERGERSAAPRGSLWPKLAVAGAIGALVVAALGPLPATGIAGHPVVRVVGSVAEHIGVREVSAPPGEAGKPVVVEGTEMTAAEASLRLGVGVVTPEAPEGFEHTSSRFFDEPLTAASGGTFALTYVGPDGAAIVVYQEQASRADFAALSDSAVNVALADGTPATYVRGTWKAAEGGPAWSEDGAQTLVFERDGARTTVQYTGPEPDTGTLFAVADSMAAAAP